MKPGQPTAIERDMRALVLPDDPDARLTQTLDQPECGNFLLERGKMITNETEHPGAIGNNEDFAATFEIVLERGDSMQCLPYGEHFTGSRSTDIFEGAVKANFVSAADRKFRFDDETIPRDIIGMGCVGDDCEIHDVVFLWKKGTSIPLGALVPHWG
jgi:hypothetical protein